ncbi:MAG: DUF5915 domain-containing protein, partial [Bacteroidia bacterium]
KPDFKKLGPKLGGKIKFLKPALAALNQGQIAEFESKGEYSLELGGEFVNLAIDDVEIASQDIEGWMVANSGNLVVALDVNISAELEQEGVAREIVNRIQNIRKNSGFEVTDKIEITLERKAKVEQSVEQFREYICTETLANELLLADELSQITESLDIEGEEVKIFIQRK